VITNSAEFRSAYEAYMEAQGEVDRYESLATLTGEDIVALASLLVRVASMEREIRTYQATKRQNYDRTS
jgi:hypothetical protein